MSKSKYLNKSKVSFFNVEINSKQIKTIISITLLLAFVLRIVTAMTYINSFDTEWYIKWATDLQNGFFNAYDGHVRQLDYPPLYFYCLYIVGKVLNIPIMADYPPFRMLTIKFFPILFDILTVWAIYLLLKKYDVLLATFGAIMWALNPATIYNCSCWGQTDTIMTFLILITLYALQEQKYIFGAILFGIAITTKLQCLYFAPIILFLFLREKEYKKLLQALGAGIATVVILFLPFMICSNNYLVILTTYTNGFGTYPYINLNAFNVYGLFDFNWVKDSTIIFGGITYSIMSTFIMIVSIVGTFLISKFGKRFSIWLSSLFMIECLFMLTTRQHERYQFIVMILCLVAFVMEKDFRLLKLFGGFCVTILLNQSVLLSKIHDSKALWVSSYENIQAICSAINILLFIYAIYICISYSFTDEKKIEISSEV